MVMDVAEIVQDPEQLSPGIAAAQPPEGFADLQDAFSLAEHSVQAIGMDVVEAKELLGSLDYTIR